MTTVMSLKKVSFNLNGAKLLSDISFDVQSGEVISIVGPNGASKTTLLKILAKEHVASEGQIDFNAKPLAAIAQKELAKSLAVLPQFSLLNFPYLVEEVVALGRTPHNSGKDVDDNIVNQVLKRFDIEYLKGREYTRLSGGEKQRTQLARVCAQIWRKEDASPRVLLLDEPTSSLDLKHQKELMTHIKSLANEGVAVVIVLHDINLAIKSSDKIIALSCGKIHFSGPAHAILDDKTLSTLFNTEIDVIHDQKSGQRLVLP